MNASQKSGIRFWRLHLSTALLLMLFASGLVYLNVRPPGTDAAWGWPVAGACDHDYGGCGYGKTHPDVASSNVAPTTDPYQHAREFLKRMEDDEGQKHRALAADSALGLLILMMIAFVSESLIRWRRA